jgi:hypothetical protein
VSVQAVSKAVAAGRLRASVEMVDGQPKIGDVELADTEWEANTQPRIDQPRAESAPRRSPPPSFDDDGELPPDVPPYNLSRARREAAAARREAAEADMAEIDAAEKKGELVSVADARADVIDKFTIVKTKILGVPSRFAQQLPKLAAEGVPVIDELLREALEELSTEQDDGEGESEEGEEEADA